MDEIYLRNQVLSSAGGEHRVEVNQRHLIDKILARYSAKFVVFRELMQNSDDAKSTKVQIFYETAKPKQDIKLKDKIIRISFKNNGFPFRPEDWDRLRKIAEGNPDEQKIGAFGVGFYSLFSVCETPFVSSGDQGMAFYWQGNQLLTKQARIYNKDKIWTSFLMDMRETEEFPEIDELAQFLANSLGFTGNLQEVSVYFNNTLVIELSKIMKDLGSTGISPEFDTYSPQEMFHITSVDVRGVQLTVKRLIIPKNIDNRNNWRFLPITDLEIEKVFIFLKIANGNLDVIVSEAFSNEMERSTKKKPPSKTTIQIIYTGYGEHNSSMNHENNISPIFENLHPFPKQGRIYIGFPTHQTTGCCIHLAARVIPTVERESIDLVDKTLAVYNSELLSLAGTLCRILYESEMSYLEHRHDKMINESIDSEEQIEWLENLAEHALTHFTFRESTPNAEVGRISESQFFECSKKKLSIYSTNGVLPITDVRIPNREMEGFIKAVPVVPEYVYDRCIRFFKKAKDSKFIEELSLKDVLFELNSRSLSEGEMIELLKWWISYRSKENNVDPSDVNHFMQLARVGDNFQPLNTINYFLNPGIVPPNMDIPNDVLPYSISKNFKNHKDFETWFKWKELSLVNWARFIVGKPDLECNPDFARKVHSTLAKSLNNLSQNDKKIIHQLFEKKKCIPTKFGMKFPQNAYFQNVNILPDLPTIDFQKPLSIQALMELLGVRKVVELQLIFDRLLHEGDWDHIQLVKYLSSKYNDLKENEKNILKKKPIWPKEIYSTKAKIRRYVANQLYSPIPLHREFGLPVIDWKGRWGRNTPEGKFLIELGLQEYPKLQKILELIVPPTPSKIRMKAFKYLNDNFKDRYSKDYKPTEINVTFLPCRKRYVYATPTNCYINSDCMKLNFNVIRQDYLYCAEQFGVQKNPSPDKLLKSLIEKPPRDIAKAKGVFEYLASQQGNFTDTDWKILGDLNFIPVKDKTRPNVINLINPHSCFLECTENSLREFFTYIDFGEIAKRFLQSCGVKNEPSTIEFAELLVKSSRELWDSPDLDKYSTILDRIAFHISVIERSKPSLITDMKREPILIGIEKKICNGEKVDHKKLASAKEIFINDEQGYQQIFKPLIAPETDLMEKFYKKLGCRSLSESVQYTVIPKGIIKKTENTMKIRKALIEKAGLFYHDISKSKILRDDEWLKNLKVRLVDHIEAVYKLNNNVQIRNDTTACVIESKELSSWVLYITPDPDNLDISQYICKHIFKSPKFKEYSYFNMILITSLSTLERKGYPVDRILKSRSQNVVKQYSQKPTVKSPVAVNSQFTQNLRNSLRNAIKTCHSNLGSTIDSQACTMVVKESESSYCDVIPGHLLCCVGNEQGIELYDTKSIKQADILSPSNRASLDRFLNILRNIASVFELELQAVHVFYDNYTNSVAFNRDSSLFFNLKFYIGLHDKECAVKPTSDAMTYWYLTFCHELAHNFIQSHSSDHEHYLTSYAEAYMSKFLTMLKNLQIS